MYQRAQVEYERQIWKRKPQLRLLKADYYAQIRTRLPANGGRWVELGSGCGGLGEFVPQVTQTDIFPSPWVDVATSAERLSFADGTLSGLIGVDVLHHLEHPLQFFREAARVLKRAGRVILLEPYVSTGSWVPWHCLHHEHCSMRETFDPTAGHFDRENNARATLWFERHRQTMESLVRPLFIEEIHRFDLFYYPLTGGFRPWSLVPSALAPGILRLDRWLGRWLGGLLGYRMLIVLRKGDAS